MKRIKILITVILVPLFLFSCKKDKVATRAFPPTEYRKGIASTAAIGILNGSDGTNWLYFVVQ